MENTTRNGTTATAANNDHDWKQKKGYGPIVVAVSLTLLLGVSFYAGSGKIETKNAAVSASSFLLQNYPRVTIVNDTPYDVRPLSRQNPSLQYTHVGYLLDFRYQNSLGMRNVCWSDHFDDPGIKAGQRWMASSSRGTCLVNKVVAVLSLPDGRGVLQCTNYEYEHDDSETGVNTGTEETTGGTAKSIFYIRMGGGDGCCVRGSWQSPRCAPKQTYVHNPDYNYKT